jgi:hypothetical protein
MRRPLGSPAISGPARETFCVLALAGALFVLTAFAAFHELEHVRGRAEDTRECPVCVWAYGTSTSIHAQIALPEAPPATEALFREPLLVLRSTAIHTLPSRAPPVIAKLSA